MPIGDVEHLDAKRIINPPSGLAHRDRAETPVRTLAYDPHLDPRLLWAGRAERGTVGVPAPSIHVHEELSAQKIIGNVRRQRLQQPLFDIVVLLEGKGIADEKDDAKATAARKMGSGGQRLGWTGAVGSCHLL